MCARSAPCLFEIVAKGFSLHYFRSHLWSSWFCGHSLYTYRSVFVQNSAKDRIHMCNVRCIDACYRLALSEITRRDHRARSPRKVARRTVVNRLWWRREVGRTSKGRDYRAKSPARAEIYAHCPRFPGPRLSRAEITTPPFLILQFRCDQENEGEKDSALIQRESEDLLYRIILSLWNRKRNSCHFFAE